LRASIVQTVILSRRRLDRIMPEMITFCGINCDQCKAFKATRAKDAEGKRHLAEQWTEELKVARASRVDR
jgi:hypothetical protein